MKWLFLCFFSFPLLAQEVANTEIFVFDLQADTQAVKIRNGKNISQNMGYDNQPSFYSDTLLIYARNRNGQTDIGGYNLMKAEEFWVNHTEGGGEYSPKRIPGTKDVAAVRLDTTGLQRLYKYDWKTGESRELIPNSKVGYFAFYSEEKLLTAVLNDTAMDLLSHDLQNNNSMTITSMAGRSLHKVPGTASMSYTVLNEDQDMDLYLLDLDAPEPSSYFLCTLPKDVRDYAWLDRNRILLGKGDQILMFDMLGDSKWKPIAELSQYKLNNITRLTVNAKGDKLALAADLVPKQE